MTREARGCCRRCSMRSAFSAACCSAIATAPRSRRSTPASVEDFRVRGLVLIAPHFFTEPSGLASIAAARVGLRDGRPEAALARYHATSKRIPRLERRLARSRIRAPGTSPTWSTTGACPRWCFRATTIDTARSRRSRIETRSYAPVDVDPRRRHPPHLERAEATLTTSPTSARLERIERQSIANQRADSHRGSGHYIEGRGLRRLSGPPLAGVTAPREIAL